MNAISRRKQRRGRGSRIVQLHNAGLASGEVDQWVRRTLRDNGTIYTIDEPLLRELRPDVILTQKLCDVCAVGYGTVARLAETLPGPPQVVNLEPTSLTDIFDDIRRVADACGVPERARSIIASLSERVGAVRLRADRISHRPRCFLMEWVEPPFCSGHWGPELMEMAGGCDSLGRMHKPLVASQLAGSNRHSSRNNSARSVRLRYRSRTTRLQVTPGPSWFRFASGSTSRRDLSRGRECLFRASGTACCR